MWQKMRNERELCEMIESSFILSKRVQIGTPVKTSSQELPRTKQEQKKKKRMLENTKTEKMDLTQIMAYSRTGHVFLSKLTDLRW